MLTCTTNKACPLLGNYSKSPCECLGQGFTMPLDAPSEPQKKCALLQRVLLMCKLCFISLSGGFTPEKKI